MESQRNIIIWILLFVPMGLVLTTSSWWAEVDSSLLPMWSWAMGIFNLALAGIGAAMFAIASLRAEKRMNCIISIEIPRRPLEGATGSICIYAPKRPRSDAHGQYRALCGDLVVTDASGRLYAGFDS